MSDLFGERQNWQTTIYVGDYPGEPVTLYGATQQELCRVVREWLLANKPTHFWNVAPDHPSDHFHEYYQTSEPESKRDSRRTYWSTPQGFEKALEHFANNGMVITKGPDQLIFERITPGRGLDLDQVRTVRRVEDSDIVNEMIGRGWHIIGLEYRGETEDNGSLVSRTAVFVMGHEEENAM